MIGEGISMVFDLFFSPRRALNGLQMKPCASNARSDISEVDSYSLKNLSPIAAPKDFEQLERWLICDGAHPNWDGKIYVARTIYWDGDRHEFLQMGCSPNYQAG